MAPRVLILHAGALGDCVLTLHVAAALRGTWPAARIEMVARSPVALLAVGRGPIDAAWDSEAFGLYHFYGPPLLPDEVTERVRSYDLLINFLGGPAERVSRRLADTAGGPVLSVDPAPRASAGSRHIIRQWLDAWAELGLGAELGPSHVLTTTEQERTAGRAALAQRAGESPSRIVLCHPGAGGRDKCCDLDTLQRIVGDLRTSGATVLWLIGPTEMEWYGTAYADRLSSTAPVVFEESVPAAARLLAGADAFIGHDAGMTHLAAALGLPTIALFGPTDPGVWAPRGPHVQVVRFGPQVPEQRLRKQVASALTLVP